MNITKVIAFERGFDCAHPGDKLVKLDKLCEWIDLLLNFCLREERNYLLGRFFLRMDPENRDLIFLRKGKKKLKSEIQFQCLTGLLGRNRQPGT